MVSSPLDGVGDQESPERRMARASSPWAPSSPPFPELWRQVPELWRARVRPAEAEGAPMPFQQAAAMPDNGNTEVFEIVGRQGRQQIHRDGI